MTRLRRKEMSDDPELRADARRNRERILVAAEELFLERGVGVALEEVAKRAKVGIATLYRRFPTREELLAAESSTTRGPTTGAACGQLRGVHGMSPPSGFAATVSRTSCRRRDAARGSPISTWGARRALAMMWPAPSSWPHFVRPLWWSYLPFVVVVSAE